MFKRFISAILTITLMLTLVPPALVSADQDDILEISNQYIKVIVNSKNGGYVISTLEGDILKKSDNNAFLTHRGENFDTSFTSFKIGSDEYVFGNKYGIFGNGTSDVVTEKSPDGEAIVSKWSADGIAIEQKISLVNNGTSEQLGTAMITYNVKNNSGSAKEIKSRILIDNRLGEKDYGYYEVPRQKLGAGYEYFEFEKTWDSSADPSVTMPSDYFVRDNPYSSNIVAYGVNSVFTEQKPYKMTFAHWANLASTVFDYTPDTTLNFTNSANDKKTADSASALYYDLKTLAPNEEKSFSTYYGVTANLKNKENKIIINSTAPSKLEFKDSTNTVYQGSDGIDNVVRINVNITNPSFNGKDYKHIAVVAYALGFETQRQTDGGNWIVYDNADPVYSDVLDFKSGENRVTYFDFKFEPKNRAQLGSFVIKIFDMDEGVNELGSYAEEYCLGSSENHIILPGRDASIPAITLGNIAPEIIYNNDTRYITVTGNGISFFKTGLLNKIELRGDNGINYPVPIENITFEQGADPKSMSIMLEGYMEPGRYQLHFIWNTNTGEEALNGVPADFTSDGMYVLLSSDVKYSNAYYGVVTVQRKDNNKYNVIAYKNEAEFERADISEEKLLFALRGDIQKDRTAENFYRLAGKDKDVNINHILNYHGSDFTVEEKSNGTVEILMDGKITTVGANTTVRNGTAVFRLNGGTEYIIPEYDTDGNVVKNGVIEKSNQDFIELKWDNAFDVLTTVGGFLIDMKYGVLGKILDDEDGDKKSDIISFGGSLDLGFMTPGGAAAMRQNTASGARWTTEPVEIQYDDNDDGYTFGLTFDEENGEFKSQVKEKDVEPANSDISRAETGAEIHDVLYGGKNPGYLGINMNAHVTLPQIVKFLPDNIEGELSVNTIGKKYEVGVDASVETAAVKMALSLVVRSSPSGAPIPDKMYFSIGGFEPGLNIDNLGVVWITGGGGGFDKLYETIYGKDGIPPLTLLLHVEFDITKILTGNADLELSLRSLKVSFDDLSLKMYKRAKFIDGGEIAVGWYPNFNLNLSAGVNFLDIMSGRFTITAAAGGDDGDFVEFVLSVALGLPKYIPIVGGMELASAELGGGSKKVWGSVELLSLIKVGFTYYWGGSIEFTHGNPSGSQNFATLSALDGESVKRTKALFNESIKPVKIGTDPSTGEEQFASVGGNLSYCAGSVAVLDFDERLKNINNTGIRLSSLENGKTEIITNAERNKHIVSFGERSDYILSVSRTDGKDIVQDDIKKSLTVTKNGENYDLRYYTAPPHNADDSTKTEALKNANVNVSGNVLYIAVPKADVSDNFVLSFSDNTAYDTAAIKVNPVSSLNAHTASLNGNVLNVSWDGENIGENAKIIVSATDGTDENSIVLNTSEIFAKDKNASITLPGKMPSGNYKVKITLSDEDICYDTYDAGNISVTNANAPTAPKSVSMENCGDDKLKITVDTEDDNFDGYLVEIFENGKLYNTGLYFDKNDEIIVGGRYSVPVIGEDKKPTGESVDAGYTPGNTYTAKVRLCKIYDPDKNTDGDEIYHSSAYVNSQSVELRKSTPPSISLKYIGGNIRISSDVPVSGELYINSEKIDGIEFDTEKSAVHTIAATLPDGEYTAEFRAVDSDGDHTVLKDTINIDTEPPKILLASPQNGGTFDGNTDAVTVTATADADAVYTFKINDEEVSPRESNIFENGLLKCTLPMKDAKNLAQITIEITAADLSGNKTVKNITLTNKNISFVRSVKIESDVPIENGRISLGENESANLKIFGILPDGGKMDITNLMQTTLDIASGTSAELADAKITAKSAGQALIRAKFDLGGNEFLYDGVVADVTDKALIYTALDELIKTAEETQNDVYTQSSWDDLQKALTSAKQVRETQGISQTDIDNASTALANALANLAKPSGKSNGDSVPYYTVSFNSNGGSSVSGRKVKRGSTVSAPENPTKDGFTFDGWYSDKNLTVPYDFNESVTKSLTLYAKWIENGGKTEAWNNPFADVSESDWFFKNVEYTFKNGLFNGTTDTTFEPNSDLTRAMLVTVLWRADGKPQTDFDIPFTDADNGEYYAEALRWAVSEGIVKGISDNLFAPNDSITREQTAAILFRYAQYKGTAPSGAWAIRLDYADTDKISDYSLEAVMYCRLKGIMMGGDNNFFSPQNNTTRAETSAVLQRYLETK